MSNVVVVSGGFDPIHIGHITKEAGHWNEYLHAQRNIYRLEGEINRLKIKNELEAKQ